MKRFVFALIAVLSLWIGSLLPAFSQVTAIPCNQLPAITGDVTRPAGSCASTLAAGSAANLNSGNLPIARLLANTNPAEGCEATPNIQLNASVGSNILTIAVKGNNGSDASATNPILICFRDSTIANGGPVWISLQAALSITTNATGATFATANSVPFRIWIVAFNNSGTVVLAFFQSVTGGATPTAIAPLNPAAVASSTAVSGSATAAGTFYTPNGTTVSSKAFRILGYVDYASGLATAGTYASAPTTVQLFGPGSKKPGEVMQSVMATTSTITNNSTSTYSTTNLSLSISPTSAPNLVRVFAQGTLRTDSGGSAGVTQIHRGATAVGSVAEMFGAGGATWGTAVNFVFDAPGTVSATTYAVKLKNTDNASQASYPKGNAADAAVIVADEVMI